MTAESKQGNCSMPIDSGWGHRGDPARLSVVVADDHPLMLAGIRRTLESDDRISVVGEAHSANELIELAERRLPDAVLMDLRMPGMPGNSCIEQLRSRWPQLTIVVLSACEDPPTIDAALAHGASSFVFKSVESGGHRGARPARRPRCRLSRGPAHATIVDVAARSAPVPSSPAASRRSSAPSRPADDRGNQSGAMGQRAHRQVPSDQHLPEARRAQPRRSDPVCARPPARSRLTPGRPGLSGMTRHRG